jgi:hypothetical protein
MRRQNDVLHAVSGEFFRGLFLKYIQRRPYLALFESLRQRGFIDQFTAGAIPDTNALFQC